MSDIKMGKVVDMDGAPFQVMNTDHLQMGRGSAVLRTKLRNLIDGSVREHTFKSGDKIEEADLSRMRASFLYREDDQFHFMNNENYEQFAFDLEQIGEISNFVKEGEDVDVMSFNGNPVTITIPTKVELKVVESPPGIKGDSAANVTKRVKLETGYEIPVPLFVKQDDIIRVNTETGEYVERV
ncbi:MAG: elongation factor P [bacterium]|nr:elongation factor P [bacterium]